MMLLVLKAIDFIHISFPSYPNMAIGTAPMFNKLRYIPHIVLFHSFVKWTRMQQMVIRPHQQRYESTTMV